MHVPHTTPQPQAPATPQPAGLVRRLLDPGTAQRAGEPVLDPTRWTRRHTGYVWIALAVAGLAGLIDALQATAAATSHGAPPVSAEQGIRAFLAALLGFALLGLAGSLRGVTLPGFLAGGFFVTAGMVSWTFTGTASRLVWLVLLVEGAVFALWVYPWLASLRELRNLPRLGTAWLGLAYWLLGAIGAALVVHLKVSVGRFAYLALFGLGALAVLVATRKSRRDLTPGIVAAFLAALAALLLVGSGNAFDDVHAVRADLWGAHMQYRFWGGPGLLYHPNSIAAISVLIAIRIAADSAFERWQRYSALGVVTIMLLLVNSRTGLLYLGVAALLHVALVLLRRIRYPGGWLAGAVAVLLPFVAIGTIAVGSGGADFLFKARYVKGDPTSGRASTWERVLDDFKADSLPEKIFGDARNVRGYVTREDTAASAADRPNLTTDNAAVGALRRGGIAGVVAFLLGLALMAWHAVRRRAAPWFTIAAIGSIVTIASSDWLLGNTGGTLWILLLAGEAYLLFPGDRTVLPATRPSAPLDDEVERPVATPS